jgi:1-deoxy-D-xylulose-5-phosphate reductoisomerase
MKRLSLYGSTGSIGTQTLDIVRAFPDKFEVVALSAGKNIAVLRGQIQEFRPRLVCVMQESDLQILNREFPGVEFCFGETGLAQMARLDVEISVMAIVGFAALTPALEAAKHSKVLALANKESLVVAAALVKEAVKKSGCKLLPVDSEHNGLFQLLEGVPREQVQTLVLTASGGPLLKKPELAMRDVTPEIAVRHPNWSMGPKISVDSATLMNKGLELVEASLLFDVPSKDIEVWIHPQSIVHSAIWLVDNTCLAQLGKPDMRAAIGHTLAYPERLPAVIPKLGLDKMSNLEFLAPDNDRFPCLSLARNALQAGEGSLVALNAANEVAVSAFLERRLRFDQIAVVVQATLDKAWSRKLTGVEAILEIDLAARQVASSFLQ